MKNSNLLLPDYSLCNNQQVNVNYLYFKPHNSVLSKAREILLLVSFLSLFLQFKFSGSSIFSFFPFLFGMIFWLDVLFISPIGNRQFKLVGLITAYSLLLILFGKGSIQYLVIYIPIGVTLCTVKCSDRKWWYCTAGLVSLLVMLDWMKSPNQYYLYEGMSRNYVSVFALYSLLIVAVASKKSGKECPLIAVIIAWGMSVSAIGRGGILSLSFVLALFGGNWAFSRKHVRRSKHRRRLFFGILAFVAVLVYASTKIDYLAATYFKRFFGYESSSVESTAIRLNMISNYITFCFNHPLALLLGGNAEQFSSSTTNLHNSFLQVHSQFGLFGFLFIMIALIRTLICHYKWKDYESVILILGIAVRGITDWCFPAFPLDLFLIMYMITAYWSKYRKIAFEI